MFQTTKQIWLFSCGYKSINIHTWGFVLIDLQLVKKKKHNCMDVQCSSPQKNMEHQINENYRS
jgi:hypothetical protein